MNLKSFFIKILMEGSMKRYESISTIGKGSYGEVLKKLDGESGHIVAVKTFEDDTLTEGVHPSVIGEIFILKKCNHPNIVKVLDWNKDLTWVSLDYYKTDLMNWVNETSHKNIDPKTMFDITFQILQGVNYLHNNGIIHRDIKPENVLLEFRGDGVPDVVLCDFSFATISYNSKDVKFQTRIGSFYYRSPELYANDAGSKAYSFEVDMWAVGCTIGAMFLKRTLFKNGINPRDQLDFIFKDLQMPSYECYMEHFCNSDSPLGPRIWTNDEYYEIIKKRYNPTLVKKFRQWGSEFASMMEGLLCIDPSLRWSAQKCLELPLFKEKISPVLKEKYENIRVNSLRENLHNICEENIDPYKGTPDIVMRHLNILVDWLIQVANQYYIPLRNYLRGIHILMKVLSIKNIDVKKELQLVGMASLLIASKIENDSLPISHENMSYISDNAYTSKAVIMMEIEILNLLKEKVFSPMSLDFLYRIELVEKLSEEDKRQVKFILTCLCLFPQFYSYRADELCENVVKMVLNKKNGVENSGISEKIALVLKDFKKEHMNHILKYRPFRGFGSCI